MVRACGRDSCRISPISRRAGRQQDPATGSLLGTAVLDSGRDLTQDEVGSSCFVAGQLVIASRFGIAMYDLTPVR